MQQTRYEAWIVRSESEKGRKVRLLIFSIAQCTDGSEFRYVFMDYAVCSTLRLNTPEDIVLSYDIVCQWRKKLAERILLYPTWLRPPQNPASIIYLIPKFHLPAHISLCRFLFSFNWTPRVARTDGEAPERGWSSTNGAACSTKEMGPGSRLDTLDDHFGDQNWRKVSIMGKSYMVS